MEMLRQAAPTMYQRSSDLAASIFTRVRQSKMGSLRPQTYWDAIALYINILSILRLFTSFYPDLDVVVIPYILSDILYVQLNDLVVISLWLLLPILCARSFLPQLRAKSNDMTFRMLFYESLFGSESRIFRSYVPILTLLLTPLSLSYIWTIVNYIYEYWTVEFATILHPLQLYPALFMIFQSVFQGCYLLWMYALPIFRNNHEKRPSFHNDLREHIYLNITFIIRCMCLTVIAHKDKPGLYHLAIGELAYRLLAVASFFYLSNQTPACNPPPPTSSCNPAVINSESTVAKEESGGGPSQPVCSSLPMPSSYQLSSRQHHSPPPQQRVVLTVPESATPQKEGDSAELVTPMRLRIQHSEFLSLGAESTSLSSDIASSPTVPIECTEKNTTSPSPQNIC